MMPRLPRVLTVLAPFSIVLMALLLAPAAQAQSYWFETYQNAVDEIERQDRGGLEHALALLDELVAEQPVPRTKVRIPGNRRLDYLPYFQRARVQSRLGMFGEARYNLEVSEAFGAVKGNRLAMNEVREIRADLSQRSAVKP
ncbi:MAG: hypothetical protein GY716_21160 [bacterium]|nr:hypothetical protein [bacterium]